MTEVLFSKIPSITFEPYYIGLLLFLFFGKYLFIHNRDKQRKFYIFITLILMIIGIRILFQIISSRYASILIIPSVLATVYLIFNAKCLLPPDIKNENKLCIKSIQFFLLFALFLGSSYKTLKTNPYDLHLAQNVENIKRELLNSDEAIFVIEEKEKNRLKYLIPKRQVIPLPAFIDQERGSSEYLKYMSIFINSFRLRHEKIYLIIKEDANQQFLTEYNLGLSRKIILKLISWKYVGRRKSTRESVYLIIGQDKMISESNLFVPYRDIGNYRKNGDCEIPMEQDAFRRLIDNMVKYPQEESFYGQTTISWPAKWAFHIDPNSENSPPEIMLDYQNPINGKASLSVRSTKYYRIMLGSFAPNKKVNIFFSIGADNNKPIKVILWLYRNPHKVFKEIELLSFSLPNSRIYQVSCDTGLISKISGISKINIFLDIDSNKIKLDDVSIVDAENDHP